ncbi:peptidase inhibitor family I36 protein [Streptomyces eurythermus]|uniref:peptidase inhibitor family I36 protein n=1 Tax=Streptomyces eurythermus TaxID=42237 RepID=UPI0033EC0810
MRRFTTAKAAVLAGAGILAVLPATATAQAAAPTVRSIQIKAASNCPANKLCFYEGANFSGQGWAFDPPTWANCRNAQASGVPAPRSVINNTGYKVVLFNRSLCINPAQITTIGPGQGITDTDPSRIYAYMSTN